MSDCKPYSMLVDTQAKILQHGGPVSDPTAYCSL
jgi:hypothetical protein